MEAPKMSTVIYVDDVPATLDFYERAFGIGAEFVDLDVSLPGREGEGRYQFAALRVEGGSLHCATHDLGRLLMPGYRRPADGQTAGVEVAFYTPDVVGLYRRAVEAGAREVAEPKEMPWGQTVAYVRSREGTFVGLCSPPPGSSG
jgi:lactoylglutathione lyase